MLLSSFFHLLISWNMIVIFLRKLMRYWMQTTQDNTAGYRSLLPALYVLLHLKIMCFIYLYTYKTFFPLFFKNVFNVCWRILLFSIQLPGTSQAFSIWSTGFYQVLNSFLNHFSLFFNYVSVLIFHSLLSVEFIFFLLSHQFHFM